MKHQNWYYFEKIILYAYEIMSFDLLVCRQWECNKNTQQINVGLFLKAEKQ